MRFTWTPTLDDHLYKVELDYGLFSGKRLIYVNGELVHKSSKFWDFGMSKHPFPIDEHAGEMRIEVKGRTVTYNLYVDGVQQETQSYTVNPRKSRKYWGGIYLMYLVIFDFFNILFVFGEIAGTILNAQSLVLLVTFVPFAYVGWRVATATHQSRILRLTICAGLAFLNLIIIFGLGLSFGPLPLPRSKRLYR